MNEDVMLRADEKKINWYPGHMARAKRALADQLSRVDVVVELCDARIPRASRNPDLADMIKNKRHLLVLGKADLAEERETRAWLGYFRAQGIDCMSFDSIRGKAKDIVARIEKASADAVAKMAAKGVKKTVRVMIVGVPNVGKSSLINRMTGKKSAQTGDRPGVTRGKQWLRLQNGMQLLDTPGILWPKFEDPKAGLNLAFCGSIKDEILDVPTLAMELIGVLAEHYPQLLMDRYKLEETGETPLETMEMMAQKRGCILPGKRIDYERIGKLTLDEFRGGKIGRITLELPPVPAKSPAEATCSADDFAVAGSHSPAETPAKEAQE